MDVHICLRGGGRWCTTFVSTQDCMREKWPVGDDPVRPALRSCPPPLAQVVLFIISMHCMAYKKVTRPPKTRSESETLQGSRERLRTQMFKGVAELALLSVVQQSAEYGLRILELLRDEAGLEIAEGTLYPLLYRLEKRGSIQSEWRVLDEASHPRKYYAITSQGKAELKAHLDDWRAMTVAFNRFLNRGKK